MRALSFLLIVGLFTIPEANAYSGSAPPGAPIQLASGLVVEFEQSGVVTFPNTSDRAAILMFIVSTEDALNKSRLNDPKYQNELHNQAVEICTRFGDDHIAAVRQSHPNERLKFVAIQLKFPVARVGAALNTMNWTSMFNIDGNKCGMRLKQNS